MKEKAATEQRFRQDILTSEQLFVTGLFLFQRYRTGIFLPPPTPLRILECKETKREKRKRKFCLNDQLPMDMNEQIIDDDAADDDNDDDDDDADDGDDDADDDDDKDNDNTEPKIANGISKRRRRKEEEEEEEEEKEEEEEEEEDEEEDGEKDQDQ